MRLIPLGIKAGGPPLHDRWPPAYVVEHEGSRVLVDCGEGTQFQLYRYGIRTHRVDAILITHLHGDHVYGLMGLLANYASEHRQRPLTVVGPQGIATLIDTLQRISDLRLPYELAVVELLDAEYRHLLELRHLVIHARRLEHSIPSYGYRIEERVRMRFDRAVAERYSLSPEHIRVLRHQGTLTVNGETLTASMLFHPVPPRAIVICGDTRPCSATVELARGADILVHEATFTETHAEEAHLRWHSTARQAAEIAQQAEVTTLLLTHISNRYHSLVELEEEARAVFPNATVCQQGVAYTILRDGTVRCEPLRLNL